MFRRQPSAPHPHADLLTDDAADASTEVFDRVPADTAVMPPVRDEASVTTGPATVVYSVPEIAPESAPSRSSLPRRRKPRRRKPRRRPRTTQAWRSTLADVRRDPRSAVYLSLIVVAAVAACWGTTVAFRPEWVPPALNPRPAAEPSIQPADYRPLRREPQVRPSVPQRPREAPEEPEPTPSKTKRPKAVLKHTERPQRPSRSPSRRPQAPAPSPSDSGIPSSTPDDDPSKTPSSGPSTEQPKDEPAEGTDQQQPPTSTPKKRTVPPT